MASQDVVRVLHVIDSLNGGGSERLLWDIVRLSESTRLRHRIVTVYPDNHRFVYAERLANLNAFTRTYHDNQPARPSLSEDAAVSLDTSRVADDAQLPSADEPPSGLSNCSNGSLLPAGQTASLTRSIAHVLPGRVKDIFRPTWLSLLHCRDGIQRAWDWIKFNHYTYMIQYLANLYRHAIQRAIIECNSFQPHVVHAHTFHGYGVGLILKLLRQRPLLYSQPCLLAQFRDAGYGWVPRLMAATNRFVDEFLTDQGYVKDLAAVGVPRSRIQTVPGVVDVDRMRETCSKRVFHRAEVLGRLGLPAGTILALSVGRLHRSKGHEYVVEAVAKLLPQFPSLHWVLLGEGEERVALQRQIAERGIASHAHLIGFTEDPTPWYAAADLYFRSMVLEGENLSSYQAMAAGLPVVGFNTESPNDLLGKIGHGVLVPNRDAGALAAAAKAILAQPDRGQSLARRGATYCRKNLGIHRLIQLLVAVYREHAKPEIPSQQSALSSRYRSAA
jgi:glycosyltransferase involved in cell wall biosynthesis